MIGQSSSDVKADNSKEITAIRDALVSFLLVLLSTLLSHGYPPQMADVYTALLSAAFIGITSYAIAMGIKKPTTTEP